MNNKALISLSLIALFGLSACSNQPRNTKAYSSVKPAAKQVTNSSKPRYATRQNAPRAQATQSKINTASNSYAKQQQLKKQQQMAAAARQKEQQRQMYHRNWQAQQQAQKQAAEQNRTMQLAAQAQAQIQQKQHARNVWQQQQARQIAQQRAQQQAQQLAQQQAQQRAQQQQLAARQQAQQYAMLLQQRPQQAPQSRNTGISGLSQAEMRAIGDKIFLNESGGDINKLVHWNDGENFASMGIGHFTWYPAGRRTRYGNTFPGLLDHLKANGVNLPVWVQRARHQGAPWRTKGELGNAKASAQIKDFQNLLYQTRDLQASYIFERAKRAMPKLVKTAPPHLRPLVAQNLNAVANTRGGWYALIDYVNFKGEGLNRSGGYKGQNWGLLQVLENMRPSQPGQMALNNFADSAIQTLQRRVNNSNPARNENRWMRGWTVRINTYRQPFVI